MYVYKWLSDYHEGTTIQSNVSGICEAPRGPRRVTTGYESLVNVFVFKKTNAVCDRLSLVLILHSAYKMDS